MFISEFRIDNFRSLKGVHIKQMRPICIFHGDNNSGKSNILAALEAIFRSKTIIDDPAAGTEKRVPFYRGTLRDFSDNFYLGKRDPIQFLVCVTFDDSELTPYQSIIEQIESELAAKSKAAKGRARRIRGLKLGDGHEKILRIEGELRYVDNSTCEAITRRIDFNTNFLLLALVNDMPVYIPSLEKKVGLDEREDVVTGIANILTDGFRVVGANRSMSTEKLSINETPSDFLAPATFKRSLFSLETKRNTYDLFKQIKDRFNSEPFWFGELSFAVDQQTEEIEVMIEKSSVRLPISRIGSGLQQILFLIASIVFNSQRMVGVEEIELNLSPEGQKRIFQTLNSLVYKTKLINQALITSHSPYIRTRKDVKYFEVTYNETSLSTVVNTASKAAEGFFSV